MQRPKSAEFIRIINIFKTMGNQTIDRPPPPPPPPSTKLSKLARQPDKIFMIIVLVSIALLMGGGAAYYFLVYDKREVNENANQEIGISSTNTVAENKNANESGATKNVNRIVNISNINSASNQNINSVGGNLNINGLINVDFVDTDEDGVFDVEENLFGTDINKADTDDDGYNDFDEIENCYNPLGSGRMTVELFKTFCPKYLVEFEKYGLWPTSESERQSICNDWSPLAQKVIDSRTAGEEEINMAEFYSAEYDDLCQKTLETIDDSSVSEDFCSIMMLAPLSFCKTSIAW